MHNEVFRVLEIDAKHRVVGDLKNNEDLFGLETLSAKEWDYSLPTLVYQNEKSKMLSMQDFGLKFREKIPFEVDMSNLLIAGGAPGCVLLNRYHVNDVDFFVYGLPVGEATARADRLITELTESYKKHLIQKNNESIDLQIRNVEHQIKSLKEKASSSNYSYTEQIQQNNVEIEKLKKLRNDYRPTFRITNIRNKNAITLNLDHHYRFQIIFRNYSCKSEILHGFDIGSSAIGFDGERLYFTSLGKFAYEYRCNIIDTTRRSTTYEKRLAKYYDRGFEIIFPNLDVSKLRSNNIKYGMSDICELPFFKFGYTNIVGNKITMKGFLQRDDLYTSDYQLEDLDEYRVFYINLGKLARGSDDYYFYQDNDENVNYLPNSILYAKPTMSRRKVIDYYDCLIQKVVKEDKAVNLRTVQKYTGSLQEMGKLFAETTGSFEQSLSGLLEREKKRVLKRLKNFDTTNFTISWKTDNPGTQLTSSVNPIFEEPQKWYGDLYTAKPAISKDNADEDD